jgi:glycosyltransferase involved in cell wall biosynthesis
MVTTVASTAWAFLRPYAEHMRSRGWLVSLATSDVAARPLISQHFDEIINLEWARNPLNIVRNSRGFLALRRQLTKLSYDVVHTHTPVASVIVRLVCATIPKGNRPSIIYTAHGFHFHRNGTRLKNAFFRCIEKFASNWLDYLIVINREDFRAAHDIALLNRDNIALVPGIGVNLAEFNENRSSYEARQAFKKRLGIPRDHAVIIMISEFSPDKRHSDLLRAVAGLSGSRWVVLFAGEGKTMQAVKQLALTLKIGENCRFLGYVANVAEYLSISDISVLPSVREGLPRAVMESMLAGVPVIGADSRGIADLLSGDCGLIHKPYDVDSLRASLARLINCEKLRTKLAKNAQIKVRQYDIVPLLSFHENLYRVARCRGKLAEELRGTPEHRVGICLTPPVKTVVIGASVSSLANVRYPLLREMAKAGSDVIAVASDRNEYAEQFLRQAGIQFAFVPMARVEASPISDICYALNLLQLIRRERPALVLAYTHKPVIYGSLALALSGYRNKVRFFGLITGLGLVFTHTGRDAAFNRARVVVVCWLYRLALKYCHGIIFQNKDDLDEFRRRQLIEPEKPTIVVDGSGVDLIKYSPFPYPTGPITFLFVSRLLVSKGVRDFASAARLVRSQYGSAVRFVLAGPCDANEDSVGMEEVNLWDSSKALSYVGPVTDVRPLINACSVFVLPSFYREGVPRTSLEALACARAIITCDSVGCRETIDEPIVECEDGVKVGSNGFLVPPRQINSLVSAMLQFVRSPRLIEEMGKASRIFVERKFNADNVNARMIKFMQ